MNSIGKDSFRKHRYNLNRYQLLGDFHPFTCANRGDPPEYEGFRDVGLLVATDEGWRCPHCDYRQDWAHAVMASEPLFLSLRKNPRMEAIWRDIRKILGDRLCRTVVALHRMRKDARHPDVVDVLLEDVRAMAAELREPIGQKS